MKKWYQSKTMWVNLLTFLTVVVGALIEFLPALEAVLSPDIYKWALGVLAAANLWLRRISKSGILAILR